MRDRFPGEFPENFSERAPTAKPVARRHGSSRESARQTRLEEYRRWADIDGIRRAICGYVRLRRGATLEASCHRRGESRFSRQLFDAGETRGEAHARVASRTWTLEALRAATEPVKVEAMQAIVEF